MTNANMTVRAAQPSDAADMARLFVQLGYRCSAAEVALRMAQPGSGTMLVAVDGASVMGVLVMHLFSPVHVPSAWALISSLVVDEGVRSAGAGALLMAAAEEVATQARCAHIELACSEQRTRAHAFYESQGFRERRKRYLKLLQQ